jgi:hypothetical protein
MGGTSSKQKRLAGQHVLITGGSAGIGLALARLYAAAGCNVSLVARSRERLDVAKAQLLAVPLQAPQRGAVQVFSADVTDFAQARGWEPRSGRPERPDTALPQPDHRLNRSSPKRCEPPPHTHTPPPARAGPVGGAGRSAAVRPAGRPHLQRRLC